MWRLAIYKGMDHLRFFYRCCGDCVVEVDVDEDAETLASIGESSCVRLGPSLGLVVSPSRYKSWSCRPNPFFSRTGLDGALCSSTFSMADSSVSVMKKAIFHNIFFFENVFYVYCRLTWHVIVQHGGGQTDFVETFPLYLNGLVDWISFAKGFCTAESRHHRWFLNRTGMDIRTDWSIYAFVFRLAIVIYQDWSVKATKYSRSQQISGRVCEKKHYAYTTILNADLQTSSPSVSPFLKFFFQKIRSRTILELKKKKKIFDSDF